MADYYIAGEPITTKVDYAFLYQQESGTDARTIDFGVEHELVEVLSERPFLLSFNTFYYPGWHAYLLDPETDAIVKELPIALRGELGLITVRVPGGLNRVLLRFEPTTIRRLGLAITFLSALLMALLIVGGLALRRGKGRKG
jgi:hypothetical protein